VSLRREGGAGVPRLVVAGTASGTGKTTVATGLMAALRTRLGLRVAGFKAGPDFIDPSYHALATGRPGRNLDAWLCGPELVAPLFAHGAAGADVAVVEGVMGLFDGAAGRGELASTAQVAKLLGAPVVLVVDAHGLARSVAALVGGYASFDPAVRVAGVIANRVGSGRHAALLREALGAIGVPLLGAVGRDDTIATPSRHLGLVPAAERAADARRTVAALAARVGAACDLDALLSLARDAPALDAPAWTPHAALAGPAPGTGATRQGPGGVPAGHEPGGAAPAPVVVAVAGGPAFTFAYQENLELLAAAGATLATFDPAGDERLPEGAAALYLGGGFPEIHARALSANARLRGEIAAFAASGRPVLAECGGLLYLARRLDGLPMCAVLDADAELRPRLTLGYREAEALTESVPWPAGACVRGHEFHHSALTPAAGDRPAWRPAWRLEPGRDEGWVARGVHASYLHTHWAATPRVAARLVAAARAAGPARPAAAGAGGRHAPAGGEPARRGRQVRGRPTASAGGPARSGGPG
jgi:cobyrinic acid a,c-diamide synthase